MYVTDEKIKDILVRGNYLLPEDVARIQEIQVREKTSFGECCLTHGFINKDLIGQAVAEMYKTSYADLNSHRPTNEQVQKLSKTFAHKYRSILFKENDKEIIITTDIPDATGLIDAVKKEFPSKKIKISYSLSEDIDDLLLTYRESLQKRVEQLLKNEAVTAPEIIDIIFDEAIILRVSDIHFEPEELDLRIRFRVDGVLAEQLVISRKYFDTILNRIKVQSEMRIDEHYIAQDGAMSHHRNNKRIDMRVSVIPTLYGEKIVIRLLAEYVQGFSLQDIGLLEEHSHILKKAIEKPFGMILVVGPTGSGKTTTLYALLKLLNDIKVNITTIEDPVEYKIEGVNQIKVNEATGLTFARGLRSIVRQDPDIILVGEIRDQETAEIAVNAALTGHIVLSTFHANDAATAIPRLLDMGVEPFLLSSTLELVIGQRLVRTLQEGCKVSNNMTKQKFTKQYGALTPFFFNKDQKAVTIYDNTCTNNLGDGFKGRTGIFEMIDISPKIKNLILKNPSTQEIWEIARQEGATTLFEDGVEKVKRGSTTIEELLRVAEPPEK